MLPHFCAVFHHFIAVNMCLWDCQSGTGPATLAVLRPVLAFRAVPMVEGLGVCGAGLHVARRVPAALQGDPRADAVAGSCI